MIVGRHYLSDPAQLELLPGAAEGLRQMQARGFGLVVVTNQFGTGCGFFSWEQLEPIHQRLHALLAVQGVYLDGIYVCLHQPQVRCRCRTPASGSLESLAMEFGFDPRNSFVISDKSSDIELGQWVGATTLWIHSGSGAQLASSQTVAADLTVDDLWEAAHVIDRLLTSRIVGQALQLK